MSKKNKHLNDQTDAPVRVGSRTVNLPKRLLQNASLSPTTLQSMDRRQLVAYVTRNDVQPSKKKKQKEGPPTQKAKVSKNAKRTFQI